MQLGRLAFTDAYRYLQHQGASAPTPFKVFFISVMSDQKIRSMNNEMEKNRGDAAPHPMDDGSTVDGGEFKKFEGFESSKGCQSEQEGGSDQREQPLEPFRTVQNPSEPTSDLEERVRADCRRSCRRNFWIELFKSAAKIAGVVLAALGLSSFNEEN